MEKCHPWNIHEIIFIGASVWDFDHFMTMAIHFMDKKLVVYLYSPTIEWIAHHFSYFFTGVANTTSTAIGLEQAGNHKVVGKDCVNIVKSQTYHTKQLNPCPNSLTSLWWITPSCLLLRGRWSHLNITWALVDALQASELTSFRNKPQQKQPGQLSAPIPSWIVS